MAKRISVRSIKANRQYTYEEAARVMNLSAQTVRSWRSLGLAVIDDQKPHLIIGSAIKEYVAKRKAKTGRPGLPHQFRCWRCRCATDAWGGLAVYVPSTPSRGWLEALCATCEGKCVRFASKAQLLDLSEHLVITLRNGRDA